MTSLENILQRNRNWANQRVADDPEYFRRLSSLQRPEYLWIGCADSRVPANVITGLEPGEVFVHRNVANVVRASDMNCMAVLQFAIEHLHVKHIIVCGHYGCGGVRAAMQAQDHGLVDYWLEPVRQLADRAADDLSALDTTQAREDRLCELNVRAQVDNICNTPILRHAWARGQAVTVHGWIYGLSDGLLHDLNCGCAGAPAAETGG
ncbi:MAG: carbonic anhydrase [Dichotomicrobium sp.]